MDKEVKAISRFIDLTEAYVYFASLEKSDDKTLKVLSDKIAKVLADNPHLLIPDIVMSAFVKNNILSDALEQGEDVEELLDGWLSVMMGRLRQAIPERVMSRKEFEKKGDDIINEAVNIIGRIDGTKR